MLKMPLVLALLGSLSALANKNVAMIKIMKGDVKISSSKGSLSPAKPKMWLTEGQKITTGKKSFARLVFTDKTSTNVAADSTLEIKAFKAGKPGLLNLVKGQIRAKVTKDILGNKDQSKLHIKTKTAAMGVRGTDFHVSTTDTGQTTVLTYEGAVAMVQVNPGEELSDNKLESALAKNESVLVTPGRFSSTSSQKGTVNQPVKIAPSQLKKLESNTTFSESSKKFAEGKADTNKAITPPGISAKTAFKVDSNVVPPEISVNTQENNVPPPEGINEGSTHAPTAGGYIDLKSGKYIEPPKGAQFDPVTETFIVPKNFGEIDESTGSYLPPPPEVNDTLASNDSSSNGSFFGEHKFIPPSSDSEREPSSEESFSGNSESDPTTTEDFVPEDLEDIAPCVVNVIECSDINTNPADEDETLLPATLKVKLRYPEG